MALKKPINSRAAFYTNIAEKQVKGAKKMPSYQKFAKQTPFAATRQAKGARILKKKQF